MDRKKADSPWLSPHSKEEAKNAGSLSSRESALSGVFESQFFKVIIPIA